MARLITTDYSLVANVPATDKWCISSIYWDLGVRCTYKGKPTRKYYEKCLEAELPLPTTNVYVNEAGFNKVVSILSDYYQYRIKSCHVYLLNFPR